MGKLCVAGLLMMAFMIASIEAQDYFSSAPDPNEIQDCPWDDQLVFGFCEELVMTSYYCDGNEDCPASKKDEPQTGEYACNGANHKCNPSITFDCGNGQCIPLSHRCNGKKDCKDNAADEKGCPKANEMCWGVNDKNEHFQKYERCDGIIDAKCPEETDEQGCKQHECHEFLQFKCNDAAAKGYKVKCIPKYKQCDCSKDCEDGADEENCGKYPWPFPN